MLTRDGSLCQSIPLYDDVRSIYELETFYHVKLSQGRIERIAEYVTNKTMELVQGFSSEFDELDQQSKVEYLLCMNYLRRKTQVLRADWFKLDELEPLLSGWAGGLVELCEKRQKVVPTTGQDAAKILSDASKGIDGLSVRIKKGKLSIENRFAPYRAAEQIEQLHQLLGEWYGFYEGYDPLFPWWTSKPWSDLSTRLQELVPLIREKLVGIKPGEDDAIVGQPIGREEIDNELKAEMIPYTPEELIQIAEREYAWCEKEAIKAAQEMGLGKDWRKALEHVKNMYVEPGQQTYMVHELAQEAIDYVTKYDMVTVPQIAKECWRTYMIPPTQQKVSPFFLGGPYIQVSYPTNTMTHEEKLMVMRGNSKPLSRSTVFHELIPGHHLQYHYMPRSKPHRQLFETPFWIEGWAFYWEMILWDRGFPGTPENRMGMLFWRMHRCARIVFSLRFHLGQMTPQECIDYLVEKVGHERSTAEGEVRRSFNGDYGALYQAGYMIGALQLYELRREVVDAGRMTEKQFHDRVLRENTMPIEMVRALVKGEKLERFYKPSRRFYDL
ncbi:hypothetical protein M409DRAFT_61940 [Zasmidium cellare ATCC 36951]|uniref:X-Pro dipeptidyl-peptidase n=1 Tax=Zasmidium cellare ATCC 36951 TaxID=1080233 RepID=A0A6A6D7I1_ZASCE|nr:uncharacterized protein M409DRAFT_61940 [Zasmidium cellare ATCC 36951]KAF2173596.1 hypothetical protein M409DRAFT_61940 [Zasmidium cellare ATCC 36951]